MGDNSKTKTTSLGWLFWAFVWGAVGYFVYGTPEGVIGLALFSAITGIIAMLGIIPVVGIWFTYMATNYIKTWLLQYIVMSWAIAIIFWMTLALSALITVIILLVIISRW